MTGHAQGSAAAHPSYVKIWAVLIVLLGVSIVGPFFGLLWLTLVTAFGIAVVKALMVAAYFMHLNIERAYVKYLLLIMLALMLVFFAGVAPDVMKSKGTNWQSADLVRPPAAPAAKH